MMMFKRILWMTMLILMSHLLYAQTTTVPYMPNDDENIVNPDRGFYYPYSSVGRMGDFTPMDPAILKNKRENLFSPYQATYQVRTGLFFRYYILDKDVTDANSLAAFSASMQQDFDALRQAGGRLIIRFAYLEKPKDQCMNDTYNYLPCRTEEDPYYGDAPLSTVTTHITALGQVLQDNEDVIAAVQIGFIGVWGEQYYTDYFGDASESPYTLSATNWTDRNKVVEELLDAVPTSRMVQIRYPQMKHKFISNNGAAAVTQSAINSIAMTDAEAYMETDKARLGFHNDCFLVNETDSGTYIDYGPNPIGPIAAQGILKPYAMNEGKYTAVGGETCVIVFDENGEPVLSPLSDCDGAKKDMEDLHFSYLNSDYSNDVNNQWTNICMAEIKRRLGYRFVMQSGTYPTTASAGSTIPITLNVNNVGYAAPYNERELWMVFRGPSGTKKAKINGASTDTRRWYPGNVTVSGSVTVPSDLSNGNYEILLHILDPSSNGRIAERHEYSIQLANMGTWEGDTGFNKLNHTIAIGGTPPSGGCITIDQSLNDWSVINILSSNAGFTVKAADDNDALYISVTGNIGPNYQFFLDTDNNNSGSNEFAYFGAWSQTGFNAMVENGLFSSYTGTGSDWLWSAETPISNSRTAAGVELKVDKSLLNASSSTIRIGFASLDATWTAVNFVPTGTSASAYTLSSSLNCNVCPDSDNDGVCDSEDACPGIDDALIGTPCNDGDVCTIGETYNANCNCTGGTSQDADQDGVCAALDPNDNDPCIPNSCNECIVIDQSLNDWSAINTLSSDAGFTVKAADDNNALYISVTGNIGPNYQIFLDTDNNNSGSNEFSYFGAWSQTGFNAMIENGQFSSYTGTGSDWLWSAETSTTNSRTAAGVELKVDKSLLNASSSTIRIGFASLDVTWTAVSFVPAGSSASAYTLSSSLSCDSSCPDSDNDGVCDADDACPGINDALIGTACNDSNACTTGDTYNSNCNCVGTFQDADGDGVCDADDACPGINDALIGTPCNDGDVCTTGETYNANCNCTGGTSQDADQDGVCAALDPNDNDPCIPNSCSECIVIDQSLNDWSAINTLSSNAGFTVKAADDNNALYISVTGNIGPNYQIFLDTDNNNSGSNEFSYFGAWSQTGFNVMLENGLFSSYTGTGSDWLWSAETPISNSRTAAGVELKVDKSLLNASSSTIRIGFASLDATWTAVSFVPVGSSASAYTLSSSLSCGDSCPDTDDDGICDADDPCPFDSTNSCNSTPTYCDASGNNTDYEYIQQVTFGNINNTSGSNGGYADFSSQVANVGLGDAVPFGLTPGFPANGYNEAWTIWIDFNRDGDFDDAGEAAYNGTSAGTLSGNINIPTTASTGLTGMRVTMQWGNPAPSCGTFAYGEVEDYTINITNIAQSYALNNLRNEDKQLTPTMRIYPNPASDMIHIAFQNTIEQEGNAHIFTVSGQLVNQQNIHSGTQNMNIPIDRLPSGIYFIRLQFDSGVYSTQRFVKLVN